MDKWSLGIGVHLCKIKQLEVAESPSSFPQHTHKVAFSLSLGMALSPVGPFCLQNPVETQPLSLGLSVLCHCERTPWRGPNWVKVQFSLCDQRGHFTFLGLFSYLW